MMINCLAQELYNTEAYSWIIVITLTSIQVFIEFFHEKENHLKFAPLPKCGLVAQLLAVLSWYLGGMGLNPAKV